MQTVENFFAELPSGVRLSCRAAGPIGAPVLLFLHGFPEAAFVWDEVMRHFAGRFRCVAPNLRGYERSSAPASVEAYRARYLIADVAGLIAQVVPPAGVRSPGRLAALVAHDWGGAVAWGLAAAMPAVLQRLVIVNAPHPTTFLHALQTSPAQQKASAYINFLCRPDAAALLAENDYARMWPFFGNLGAIADGDWLTDAARERYRQVWRQGLDGPLNYYRASPLRPPASDEPSGSATVMRVVLPDDVVRVQVPTRVVWGMRDSALLPTLLDGLEAWVPDLQVARVDDATHWIVHEQPHRVCAEIERALLRV